LEFWETYKIEEMGNFLMAANETLKKTEVTTVETKPVVKDSLSALLTNGGVQLQQKGNNPLRQNYYWAVDLF
jgi:SecD/SecF fusion protein